jgi:hypothetical protein
MSSKMVATSTSARSEVRRVSRNFREEKKSRGEKTPMTTEEQKLLRALENQEALFLSTLAHRQNCRRACESCRFDPCRPVIVFMRS